MGAPWDIGSRAPDRNLFGSAANFAAQPFEQNEYVMPPCSCCPAGRAGSTVIPQTGSTTVPVPLVPVTSSSSEARAGVLERRRRATARRS
jgi:hypothetical protein